MTDALPRNAVLLVVDVQKGFDRFNEELHRNNPALETNIARLPRGWRSTGRPLIHVQHPSRRPESPLRPHQSRWQITAEVRALPSEHVEQTTQQKSFMVMRRTLTLCHP